MFKSIVIAAGLCVGLATSAHAQQQSPCAFSIAAYGGSTGSTDNTAAFNAAVAANPTNACVSFPPGTYTFLSPLTVNMPSGVAGGFSLSGAGPGTTKLKWPNAGGGLTVWLGSHQQSARFVGLDFMTGQASGGTAITLAQTTSGGTVLDPMNVFDNVTAHGADGYSGTDYWNIGFHTSGVFNVNFISPYIAGNYAFNATGILVEYGMQFNIIGGNFLCVDKALVYGNYAQGVTVSSGSNFVCGNYGVFVPPTSLGTDQLTITGSQFNMNKCGILEQASVSSTLITNNLFVAGNNTAAGAKAICIGDATYAVNEQFTIAHNNFQASQQSGDVGVDVFGPSLGLIEGNQCIFNNLCFKLEANTGSVHITNDNLFGGNTTNISNLNANNRIDP
jgi:Pectate lyase superfamily protein